MAATQWPFLAAVLLLLSSGLHCSSSLPTCPQSCNCRKATLLNCSSSGLSSVPQLIQDSVTELDLSHNLLDSVTLHRPHRNLRNVRLGNNTIAHLSLCIDRNLDGKYLRGRRGLRPWSRGRCVPWAPTLQLLSVERNLLEQLPEGLEGVGSLQVLQLSFNRISTLRPEDLSHLNQLKELDLKHNLITSLHPQMFQGLVQLKVLDLSFNMLTSLNPLMYFTLRNIGVDVGLGGNRWKCDCRMRSLRRRMAYDSSRGLQIWKMVCAFPSALSGRDLLQLEEDDLNCFSTEIIPEIHQDVTVYSGSEILLSCSAEDSVWWTPNGQASVSRPQAGLLISDITERDTGLYVCVSEENQVVSVFNLQISQIGGAKRKPRSVPNISRQIIPQGLNRIGELRNQTTTQSDLALAVCLSILFTFLIAFILGVLARPCIDVLWKRVTTKKRSTETHVVSSVEQRQYDNEAYSVGEEQEAVEHFRERRVTFSDVDHREENNVQYYDTVASGDQESIDNDEVFDGEAAEAKRAKRTAGDSGSDSSSLQSNQGDEQNNGRDLSGKASAGQTHNMEFEQIPESSELEKRRTMSSSSDSSQSENEVDHTTPKSPQVALDSLQQKSDLPTTGKVEVPQISIEARSEIHGFSSEPFSDWSPYKNSTDHAVLQENEDLFEFSDSTRSSSAFDSFNDSKLPVAATSDKKKSDDTSSSSSSSHVSEDEHYTVNSDNKKGDYRHDTKRPAPRPGHSFSSDSSDSDDEPVQSTVKLAGKEKLIHENDKLSSQTVTGEKDVSEKIKPMPRTKWRSVGLAVASVSKGVAPSPPARHSSTSSSDNEAQITDLKGKQNKGTVSQKKVTLNNSAPSPSSGSSSSSDSEEETTKHIRKQEQGDVYMSRPPIKVSRTVSREQETQRPAVDFEHTTSIKRHPDIKAPSISSDSSSSSDSEDETTGQTKKQRDIHVTQFPLKGSQTGSHEPETKRPALDLEYTTSIKRQVDIQAPSAPSDSSSSSDSEDETKGQTEKRRPGKFDTPQLTFQGSQTKSPDARWPTLDLQHIPRIKRRLDIKVPSQTSDSSSSSDSEEETKKFIKKQEPGNVHMPRFPIKVPQTVSHEPGTKRPAVDHQHTTSIKRHPGTKAQSASSDSSSSSDSEDDTTGHREKERPGKLNTAGLLLQKPQTKSPDPNAKWPTLDLLRVPRLKRRLDIKAPSAASDSSSSSDSGEETTKSIKKQEQENVHIPTPPIKVSHTLSHDPGTQRTLLDLEHTTSIKKRPLIKAPSASSDSSTSSDSEDETTGHMEKQRPGKLNTAEMLLKKPQTKSPDPNEKWPTLDLHRIPRLKRRLDIKAPSAASDSSSSSDSEEDTKSIKKQQQGELHMSRPSVKVSQTLSRDPGTHQTLLDLEHTTPIKKRPLIKAPSASSDSSSSSDSEVETTKSTGEQEQGKLHMSRPSIKVSPTVSRDPRTQRPLLDLDHTTPIKRHPDIKVPSASSDSSSSSDSDDETGHMEKQRSGKLITTGLPLQGSQTKPHDPDAKWPGLDLRHIPRLKRRLDIKAPSPASHSSSSSDSEEERTKSIKNNGELHMSRPSVKVSQTVSRNPGTQRPLLDLEYTAPTKRHPDIKEPSPASDSSSSSDSDVETTTHIQKPEQGNILPSSPPNKVSPTVSHEPETRWPLLDLERTTSVKRRLDIKPLSAASDSSSSSDSDDETSHMEKQRPGKLIMTGLPLQGFQRKSHDPDAKWPSLDLWHIPRLKRRLDIKAPSPASDSSSSSDSEEETTKSIKNHGELHMSRPSIKVSQTVSRNPGTQRPLLDFEYTTPIKRHPDIKEPSPASDSSSSSDSEDETTTHIKKPEQGNILPSRPPNKVSPTVIHEPETRWPLIDLERTTSAKRRLDIKPLSAASDSSSSSDSDDETTKHMKKQEQQPPVKVSQTVSLKPETQRPAINLEHTTSMKKQLDVKAPSASSDSSSSSDSDDETSHTEKQMPGKLITTGLPLQGSQTKRHDSDAKWSGLDLRHIPRLKRRLDIKAPSPAFHSSSSSDSEEETTKSIKKQQQGELHMSRPSVKVSQTVSGDPGTQRPLLNLEHTSPIKRHPDIKAPSPASDSSSSSDSEDETTTSTMKKGDVHVAQLPSKMSQTASHKPETRWPLLDLEHTTSIKRRLDIKTVPSGSSSSNDSGGEQTTTYIKKQNQVELHLSRLPIEISQTVSQKPESRQPAISLEHTASIKTCQDVNAPSADSDSSSSSDSENETTGHTEKQRPGKLDIAGLPFRQSPSVDLGNITHKKQLDIKALPTQPDLGLKSVSLGSRKSESSSSTSDSEDEKRDHKAKVGAGVSVTSRVPEKDLMSFPKTPLRNIFHSPKTEHNIKLIKYTVVPDDGGNKPTNDSIHKTPEISSELQSRWATMNLGLSRSRKRLESTSQKQKSSDLPSSPPPDSPSYSGESGPGSPISRTRLKREDVGITLTGSSLIHDNKLVNASLTMKDQSDTMFGFGAPDNTKHLDIRGSEKAPATASQQQPDSSSSSDTEDERVDHKASDLSFGIPRIHRHLNIKAPSPEPSSSSSSSSESEKEVQKYSDKQSRYALKTTDSDSAITYKRAIIKTSSLPGNSLSPSGKSQSVDHANAPTSPRTAPSMSFDDMVKSRIQQSKRKTDLDLPPKLTWPGVGHHPSDLSISTPNLNTASIQPASLAEPKPPPAYTSSIKSDIKIKQDSGKSDVTIVHKHSSLRADPVSPTSRGALHKLMNLPSNTYETPRAVTEDTRERKGLKALKNMALERQKWEAEDLNRGPFSLFDGSIQPSDTSFDYRGSEADIKVLSKQPLTHLPSASIIERRATDLSYEVPHYRSHNVREPSHAIPPAIPATPPPPYEAAGLTWRPPQNTQKQVWEGKISHQQQRKSSEGSDTSSENSNSLNFDYSNAISHV